MARLPRLFAKGQPQHIIQRGLNNQRVFATEPDYLYYLDCLEHAADEHRLAIHAYVLMPNHIHLLATPFNDTSAPKTLQSVGRRYVQFFNANNNRSGTLWQSRYRSTVIDAGAYLLICMRYIESNPLRTGNRIAHPADYPWSSYAGNALGKSDSLLTPHPLYHQLGGSPRARAAQYRKLSRTLPSEADIMAINEATNKAWALGNKRFQTRIETLAGRRAAPLPRGRPRKA